MQALAKQLQWLIAIRLVVVTSVVLPYFLVFAVFAVVETVRALT